MKTFFIAIASLLFSGYSMAQYYYLDIIGTRQTNQQYKLLRAFQYKSISATSYEGNMPLKDFLLEQRISNDGTQIITHSANIGNNESYFISNFSNNRVVKTVDSSTNAINTVLYEYDNVGRLASTTNTSKDFDGKFTSVERHVWSYNEKGLPEKMLKIKNGSDTTLITFALD